MDLVVALNVAVSGPVDGAPLVFLHGFGCGQAMWRHVAPAFEADHRVVLLDLPGSGDTDPAAYDAERHASLEGYAADVLAVLDRLDLRDVTVVGHSVSAMIAVLAHNTAPDVVSRLVLVSPSARYLDDGDYRGGFTAADIDELIELMDRNHLGWQAPLAGMVAGGPEAGARPELEDSFCRTDPDIAVRFAELTFRGDNRDDLGAVRAPTLVLQVRDDVVAPMTAGQHVHDHVAGSVLRIVETRGHVPHLSAPGAVTREIAEFVGAAAR